ncbi:UNVERIFIED_CONTAM: hypothetical protein Sangu_1780200 [Sesamum angustifolium]|uniref:Endonuclease/exonuclease/phosphatase domain-containing protein n=1 Tax=Sesamum angustifolium TaxID=2727405 RepID=A0AAW2M763_9LAMI
MSFFRVFHITTLMSQFDSPFWWRFTGLYGEPDTGQREITWKSCRLHDQSRRAWLCAGDFNEILDQSEKLGGLARPMWQIRKFREALEQCELVDLGFAGTPFTWCNRHSEPNTVYERLDRACANLGWSQLFPDTSIEHVPVNCSDHVALVIRLMDKPQYAERSIRPWRFEAAWLQSEQFEGVVEEGWGSCMGQRGVLGVAEQIERCKASLKKWRLTTRRTSKHRVQYLENKLARLLKSRISPEINHTIAEIREELERGAAHDETVWKQRSKVLWLREGDRNTGFFH